MKRYVLIAAVLAAIAPAQAQAQTQTKTIQFKMTVSAGAKACLQRNNIEPSADVIDHSAGDVEDLVVSVHNLPPNTDFDFFIIQVPNKPFGASWYMGDISTDKTGAGVGTFIGRFSSETFIISPGATPAPNEFPDPPAVVPEQTAGIQNQSRADVSLLDLVQFAG